MAINYASVIPVSLFSGIENSIVEPVVTLSAPRGVRPFMRQTTFTNASHIVIPDISLSSNFKLSCQVVWENTGNTRSVMGAGGATTSSYIATISGRLNIRCGATEGYVTSFRPTVGNRYHIVVERVGDNLRCYVDGIEVLNVTNDDTFLIQYFYCNREVENNFFGSVSDVHIWNNGNLIHEYPVDDGDNVIRDLIGGNDGTFVTQTDYDWVTYTKQEDNTWVSEDLISDTLWANSTTFGGTQAQLQWSFANGQWTYTGVGGVSALSTIHWLRLPAVHTLSGTMTNVTGVGMKMYNDQNFMVTQDGLYSYDSADVGTSLQIQIPNNGDIASATISKPSIVGKYLLHDWS